MKTVMIVHKKVIEDRNIDPFSIERETKQSKESDTNMIILEKCRQARDILEGLPIPDKDKEIFAWRIFADNPYVHGPGMKATPWSVAPTIR